MVLKKKGHIRQYKVEYTEIASNYTQSREVGDKTRHLMVVDLKKNAHYTIKVSAATIKGYGPASQPLLVLTEQDGWYRMLLISKFELLLTIIFTFHS